MNTPTSERGPLAEPAAQPLTSYRVAQAALGHCIVMRDENGFESVIEAGIKSYTSACKKRDRWIAKEAKAQASARP